MPKYRKKPIVIEAEQFWPNKDWPKGVHTTAVDPNDPSKGNQVVIKTLEGDLHVSSGDWIITGIAGERYPCKDDIFRETYELVGD